MTAEGVKQRGAVGLKLEVQTSPSDVSQCGPTRQTIDPTTSSVVTISEGSDKGVGKSEQKLRAWG